MHVLALVLEPLDRAVAHRVVPWAKHEGLRVRVAVVLHEGVSLPEELPRGLAQSPSGLPRLVLEGGQIELGLLSVLLTGDLPDGD